MAERPGQHRLAQVEAPAAVGGQRRVQRLQVAVVVEADSPLRVEAVPLAGHRHVLRAGQPQPHRAAGEGRPQRRDRGEAVRLHLLAAEAAAHPQALHGHVVVVQAEDVGHDLLRLGRVLGAALHEDLAGLVDQRQRAVGLEVEVLLAGHLGLAAEHVRRPAEPGLDVAALHRGLPALEAVRRDRLAHTDDRGQRVVVDLDRERAEPRGLEGVAEHPADRVADEHHLGGEQRLVVLDAGVVDARNVVGGRARGPRPARRTPARGRAGSPGRGRGAPGPGGRAGRRGSARPGRRCRARRR